MRRGKPWAWIIFGLGALYFMLPLLATFIFSLRMRRDQLTFDAYLSVFGDTRFQSTLTYSLVIGLLAIIVRKMWQQGKANKKRKVCVEYKGLRARVLAIHLFGGVN